MRIGIKDDGAGIVWKMIRMVSQRITPGNDGEPACHCIAQPSAISQNRLRHSRAGKMSISRPHGVCKPATDRLHLCRPVWINGMGQRFRRFGIIHHPAHIDRCFDIDTRVRAAFTLIGIQQRIWRVPAQHCSQFPAKIRHIPDTCTHPLPQKWRHQMRGITSNETAPVTPFIR